MLSLLGTGSEFHEKLFMDEIVLYMRMTSTLLRNKTSTGMLFKRVYQITRSIFYNEFMTILR